MKLYQFAWGIYPRRVHVYLMEKGISDIGMVELDVIAGENRKREYLAMNPTGTIPMLETGNGSYVCQSTSILLYLEEQYPDNPMVGATAEARARTMDQLLMINEAYNFAGPCTFYGSPLFAQRRPPNDDLARAFYDEYARVMESLETAAGDTEYLGGDQPSIADVTLFASEQFMRTIYKLRLPESCTRLEAIYNRFLARQSAAAPSYPAIVLEHGPLRIFAAKTI